MTALQQSAALIGAYPDLPGLSRLRAAARRADPEALQAAATQFEAVFLQMMLQSMRETTPGDSLFGGDVGLYRDLFDRQISLELAKSGGIGFADLLIRQLGPETTSAAARVPVSMPQRMVRAAPTAAPAASTPPSNSPDAYGSPEDFIQALKPAAERAAQVLSLAPQVLLAQAALETGWGKSVIRGGDGRSSHNLFGIKADSQWAGETVTVSTLEFRDGIFTPERAVFRAYRSPGQSFEDYVTFLRNQPRYRDALAQSAHPKAFLEALQAAGYATDPHYATKVMTVLDQSVLRR
jgi:flagellar protein FlgJ